MSIEDEEWAKYHEAMDEERKKPPYNPEEHGFRKSRDSEGAFYWVDMRKDEPRRKDYEDDIDGPDSWED